MIALPLSLLLHLAATGELVVLTQGSVAQYAQVVEGIKAVRGEIHEIDVGKPDELAAAVAAKPDAVIAVGSKAFELAREKVTTAPVIAAAVLRPSRSGHDNVTAVPMESRGAELAQATRMLLPASKKVLALHPGADDEGLADVKSAAAASGFTLEVRVVGELSGFQETFRAAVPGHEAVWILADPRVAKPEIVKFMVATCVEQNIALFGFLEGMTKAGALASVAADYVAIGREAAGFASELAGKKKVPFRFAAGKVSVNERTRSALSLGTALPPGAQLIR